MASKYSVKDYDIKFKELLKELPYQPSKPEYSKLKERDQIEHVLYFNAVEAKKKENKPLNRYINIFPYDYNRIVLKEPVNERDYLNGSYINSPENLKEFNPELKKLLDLSKYDNIQFLATQGPLPHTCEHQWQAVFDNNVDIIIMLTRVVEGSKETNNEKPKCEQYWPSVKEQCQYQHMCRHGKFEIMVVDEEEVRPNLIKTDLYLIDTESRNIDDEKLVTHLQYTGWPDFGAPEETSEIIDLVKDVRKMIKDNKEKDNNYSILTHCSAGVGRTGTFIALYKLMEEIDEKLEMHLEQVEDKSKKRTSTDPLKRLNVFQTVLSLRRKRVEMVQSYAQYNYLYACVADYLKEANRMYALADEYQSLMNFEEI